MDKIFYSFRRCPYAIRARLALAYSGQQVQLREVALKNKPPEMLARSAKGTVPVLLLSNTELLQESLDIMVWALEKSDPDGWLQADLPAMVNLIDENDFEFKHCLDQYKYAADQQTANHHYNQAQDFLFKLENRLLTSPYLFGQKISLADISIFPFIRQFAAVDHQRFAASPFPYLQKWLTQFNDSELFQSVMEKYPTWLESGKQFSFPKTR